MDLRHLAISFPHVLDHILSYLSLSDIKKLHKIFNTGSKPPFVLEWFYYSTPSYGIVFNFNSKNEDMDIVGVGAPVQSQFLSLVGKLVVQKIETEMKMEQRNLIIISKKLKLFATVRDKVFGDGRVILTLYDIKGRTIKTKTFSTAKKYSLHIQQTGMNCKIIYTNNSPPIRSVLRLQAWKWDS